jgi:hypothetical protein
MTEQQLIARRRARIRVLMIVGGLAYAITALLFALAHA